MAGPAIKWILSPAGFLKLISLILIFICIGFYFHFGTFMAPAGEDPGGVLGFLGIKPTVAALAAKGFPDQGSVYLAHVVLSTIFFILLYYVISFITGESKPREYPISEVVFLFVHGILAIVSGCLIFSVKEDDRKNKYRNMEVQYYSYFVLMVIIGILMIVNAVLTSIQMYRDRRNYF